MYRGIVHTLTFFSQIIVPTNNRFFLDQRGALMLLKMLDPEISVMDLIRYEKLEAAFKDAVQS